MKLWVILDGEYDGPDPKIYLSAEETLTYLVDNLPDGEIRLYPFEVSLPTDPDIFRKVEVEE